MDDPASAVVLGALEGASLSDEEREFLLAEAPAGVTLFSRNILPADGSMLGELTQQLQSVRPAGHPPLIIAIDQEGGRVARLKAPFPNHGPAMHLAEGGSSPLALQALADYGQQVANSLRRLGINVNFAPVVDVLTEPSNHAIGDRAFGVEAEVVGWRAGAFLAGLTTGGVLGCLKHFPGQGAAQVDTHLGSAVIAKDLAELEACDLQPYRSLLPASPMVMISHCLYPALDPECEASLSPRIINGLLKEQLGYQGVVVSDDMTMGAIAQKPGALAQQIVRAIACGNDLVLICRGLQVWREALQALRREAKESSTFRRRLEEAASRVMALRRALV